ncbi:MAG: SPOR domain-containing protein [Candidatus Aminicenantales bacterium]
MTIEKPFRELKFSSAHLIIVFLAILVLGVFIFLLGISVGKKQSQLTAMVSSSTDIKNEQVGQKPAIPEGAAAQTMGTQAPPASQSQPLAAQPETKNALPSAKRAEEKKTETQSASKPKENQTMTSAGNKPDDKKETPPIKEKSDEMKPAMETKKPAEIKESKTEPAKKAVSPAAMKQEGIFYVQIGAVTDKEAADEFAQKVQKLGFPSIVKLPSASDKKSIYRIQIGPYDSKQNASGAQEKIAAALKKKKTDFFVVKG